MNRIKVAISSKRHGAIKRNKQIQQKNLDAFLKEFNIDPETLVLMKQVHGNTVRTLEDRKSILDETDGIVSKKKNMFLGVVTADCVPLILFDKEHGVVGVVHVGYKGALLGVVENVVKKMEESGAYPSHIEVIIGPAIGVCCYNIEKDRATDFKNMFGESVIEERNKEQFLNLSKVVKNILIEKGIKAENIFDSNICTSCHNDEYFSYRGEGKDNFGTFLSVIGME